MSRRRGVPRALLAFVVAFAAWGLAYQFAQPLAALVLVTVLADTFLAVIYARFAG